MMAIGVVTTSTSNTILNGYKYSTQQQLSTSAKDITTYISNARKAQRMRSATSKEYWQAIFKSHSRDREKGKRSETAHGTNFKTYRYDRTNNYYYACLLYSRHLCRKTLERVYTRVTMGRQGGYRPQRFAQLKNYGKDTYRHIDTDRRFIVAWGIQRVYREQTKTP